MRQLKSLKKIPLQIIIIISLVTFTIGIFVGFSYQESNSGKKVKDLNNKIVDLELEFDLAVGKRARRIESSISTYKYNDLIVYSPLFEGKKVYTTHYTYLKNTDIYNNRLDLTGNDQDPYMGTTNFTMTLWISKGLPVVIANGGNPGLVIEDINEVVKKWGNEAYITKNGYKMYVQYHYYAGGYYAVSLNYDYQNPADSSTTHYLFSFVRNGLEGKTLLDPDVNQAKQELMKFADSLVYRKVQK